MPELTGPYSAPDGAFVEIVVGISRSHLRSLRAQLLPIPPTALQTVTLRGLLDSGAERTLVDANAVRHLNLPVSYSSAPPGIPVMQFVNLPALGGATFAVQVRASLTVPHPDPALSLEIPDCPLLELDLSATPYEAVIGRDVLARCVLTLDGPAGTFTLRY